MPATMNQQMDPRQDVQHAPRPGSDILPGITVADRVAPVMGSAAHVLVVLDPDRGTASADHLLEAACNRLGQLEDRWSRFRPGSEISRLNRAEGAPVAVTADTMELLARCVHGWRATSGLFDPSVHDALVRLGYDRSIELLPPPPPATSAPPHPVPIGIMPTGIMPTGIMPTGIMPTGIMPISMVPDGTVPMSTAPAWIMPTGMAAPGGGPGWQMLVEGASAAPGCGSVELDRGAGTARLGPGVAIDPGGIGKGLAADLVVAELLAAGAVGAMVNVGGDTVVEGRPPRPSGWQIGVADPRLGSNRPPSGSLPEPTGAQGLCAVVGLTAGAVVTSTTAERRWGMDGVTVHHLIDPRSGLPAGAGLASVTVMSSAGWWAEALAKAAFVAGLEGARGLLSAMGATGLAVRTDGTIEPFAGLTPYLR